MTDDVTELRIKRMEETLADCRRQVAEILEQLRSEQSPPALRVVPDAPT